MDRDDICQAHAVLEWDYNEGGWLRERPSNQRRMESSGVQLRRLKFKAHPNLNFEALSEDGKEVYLTNVVRWKLPVDEDLKARIVEYFTPEFLTASGHPSFQSVVETPKL